MKVKDILAMVAPDVPLTICEASGRLHYVGAVLGAHRFDEWKLAQISASGSRIVLIVANDEML